MVRMTKKNRTLGFLIACLPCAGLSAQGVGPDVIHPRTHKIDRVETELPIRDIIAVGGFVGGRIEKNKVNYLSPFPIENYVGLIEHPAFTDWDWRKGEQPGKWIEAAALTSERTGDKALEARARAMYKDILQSQSPDGYVGITSPTVRTPEKPLRGMDAYELYFLLHSLLTGYETWKDPKGLETAKKLGDYFVKTIGPGKAAFWPSDARPPENVHKVLKGTLHSAIAGHSIHYSWEGTLLIDPMMRLYELTGDKRYLTWCEWVVSNIDVWSGWNSYSNLDSVAAGTMPINAVQPYVHAHTFQMNFLGLLRLYQVTGDPSYLRKVTGAWDDIARRQMYITGSVSVGEHYERDYVKPLSGEMMETCAAMSWMQLSEYLLELTGDTKYADVMEKVWWNQVFAAQTIDGDANRYFTPPDGVEPRGDYRDPDCCSSSGERLLSMLPDFIYNQGKGILYVNQFVPSSVDMAEARLTQTTDYPSGTQDIISIDPKKTGAFTLAIRIPAWCKDPKVLVNGEAQPSPQPGCYLNLTRTWKKGDKVTLEFPMQLSWVRHDHYQNTSIKKPYKTTPDADAPYALVRGPLVYAVDNLWYEGDSADRPKDVMNDVKYVLSDPSTFKTVVGTDLLGPGYIVPLQTSTGKYISMSVYPFANVGKWYKDPAHKPAKDSAAYSYGIWLKGISAASGDRRTDGSSVNRGPDGNFYAPVPGSLMLPKILDDNMVLQQGQPLPIWGMAEPGANIQVTFAGQTKTTVAGADGHWQVNLDPLSASDQPQDMAIAAGRETIHLRNIVTGEVWLCSGQSNMEYSMRKNSKFETAPKYPAPKGALDSAHNPYIRIFFVRKDIYKSGAPHTWDTAVGRALRDFSAAGYFFAKDLYEALHVPIGMIDASVSGSNIGPWLPAASGAASVAAGTEAAASATAAAGTTASAAPTSAAVSADDIRRSQAGIRQAGGDIDTTATAGKFYTDMISPLAPFGLKGFLWYQGETNTFLNENIAYTRKMNLLIDSWRALWGGEARSFYFVQLPPFFYSKSKGGLPHTEETLPEFREAQALCLQKPHTGMIVTTDLVDSPEDLHPPYKWVVGHRLALWALAVDYDKKDLVYSGPLYKDMQIRRDKITLSFNHIGGGLVSENGQALDWFFIAGKDGHFVPAKAVIKGDEVVVSSPDVKAPVAVRFGWNEGAQPNLFNKAGLPASPFRTDNPYTTNNLTSK